MIEKLETTKQTDCLGTAECAPSLAQMMDKINEIIEVSNSLSFKIDRLYENLNYMIGAQQQTKHFNNL